MLSLDLRADRVLSRDADLAGLGAAEVLARLAPSGMREVIVLDLARVGSGAGPDVALLRDLWARFPELELLAGGGVRDAGDLRALAEAGAAGALVATAIHGGMLEPTTVSRCSASAAATSTPVALSTPCQPGMPLTSST